MKINGPLLFALVCGLFGGIVTLSLNLAVRNAVRQELKRAKVIGYRDGTNEWFELPKNYTNYRSYSGVVFTGPTNRTLELQSNSIYEVRRLELEWNDSWKPWMKVWNTESGKEIP